MKIVTPMITILGLGIMLFGCGTDARPSFFINMVRNPADIDALTECMHEAPTEEGELIVLKGNKQCLIDLSNGQQPTELSAETISRNPAFYIDRPITFTGRIKNISFRDEILDWIEVYTNNLEARFYIYNHDRINLPIVIEKNQTYRFEVRIWEIKRHADHGRVWEIRSEFINTETERFIELVGW